MVDGIFKGGLISERFSFWLESPNKGSKNDNDNTGCGVFKGGQN